MQSWKFFWQTLALKFSKSFILFFIILWSLAFKVFECQEWNAIFNDNTNFFFGQCACRRLPTRLSILEALVTIGESEHLSQDLVKHLPLGFNGMPKKRRTVSFNHSPIQVRNSFLLLQSILWLSLTLKYLFLTVFFHIFQMNGFTSI